MQKLWPFILNLLLFAAIACMGPYTVLYYQSLGFTGTQIGLLAGLAPLITCFGAPLWTGLADMSRRHRLFMNLALLGAAITALAFPIFNTFAPILVIVILFSAFFAPVLSFADSAAMYMLADEKEMYGRVRLGGTLGFGLVAPLAGVLVQNYGLTIAFWGFALLFLLAFLVSQKLVYSKPNTIASSRDGIFTLLANRRWLLFLTTAFAGGLALAATNTYFFPYLKELGAKESTMGLSLTLGTVSEIPVLFFGHRLLGRFKASGLLMLAMACTGLRLILFAASGTPNLALLLQLFNGLTYPAMWVAVVAYANENAPANMRATAQGLVGAMVGGFGMAVGGIIGGPVMENWGTRGLYLLLGIVILATITIVSLIQRWTSMGQKPASEGAR